MYDVVFIDDLVIDAVVVEEFLGLLNIETRIIVEIGLNEEVLLIGEFLDAVNTTVMSLLHIRQYDGQLIDNIIMCLLCHVWIIEVFDEDVVDGLVGLLLSVFYTINMLNGVLGYILVIAIVINFSDFLIVVVHVRWYDINNFFMLLMSYLCFLVGLNTLTRTLYLCRLLILICSIHYRRRQIL